MVVIILRVIMMTVMPEPASTPIACAVHRQVIDVICEDVICEVKLTACRSHDGMKIHSSMVPDVVAGLGYDWHC